MTAGGTGTVLKIGLVGPTRIGKTTIINSLLRSGEGLLARTSVRMRWADSMTERRIQKQRKELEGWRVSRQFNPGALAGSQDVFHFRLMFDPGVPGAQLGIDVLDYPGAWLDPAKRAGNDTDWESCRSFIADSTVLLIPADAVVVMETIGDDERRHIPSILTTPEVEDVARDWARRRHQLPDEPALAIICPVRTESYFADNGGRRDRSAELFEHVREVYGEIIQAIRAEAPAARIRYCPIDTVGCVEFMSASWASAEGTGEPHFMANYRIRRRPDGRPPEISQAGVDDVLVLIARHLFDLGRRTLEDDARTKWVTATHQSQMAGRNDGMWLNTWYWLTGQREQWRRSAGASRALAQEADGVVADLGRQLKRLAELELGTRIRDL